MNRISLIMAISALLLSACNESSTSSTVTPSPAEPAAANRINPIAGCGWARVFDPSLINVAYPDTGANYWLALVPNPGPNGHVILDGRYPEARYFSFNSYQASSAPNDAIADYQLTPAPGSVNPFRSPADISDSAPRGGRYTAYLVHGSIPENRAPNTFYSGALLTLGGEVPNAALSPIIYRTYVPEPGSGLDGNVGLPQLALQQGGQRLPLAEREDCTARLNQALETLQLGRLNAAIVNADVPDVTGGPPFLRASEPVAFKKFHGLGLGLLFPELPDQIISLRANGGFFSNVDNKYVFATFARNIAPLYLVRGKAPRIPQGGQTGQVRYWSVCQNEFLTQRVTACIQDANATLDDEGFYYVVVSDPADRPENATPAAGFDFLPWGAYYDGLVIVRNMLPEPSFAEAIQNVGLQDDEATVMGRFLPQATYCDPAIFAAQKGRSPRDVFSACVASRNLGASP